jgi:hypothetical protein
MAIADSIESCKTCRFFLAPQGAIGVCRAHPVYQNRHANDWCGEYTVYSFAKLYDQIDEQRKIEAEIIAEPEVEVVVKAKRGRKAKGEV